MIDALSPRTGFDPAAAARKAALATGFTLYVALCAFTTIILPPIGALFLLPLIFAIYLVAPAGRAAPRKLVFGLILVAAALLAIWPVYIFVKPGPLPILTPPRLVLYAVTAFWLYDMAFSPLRRAQFAVGVKRSGALSLFVFGFFLLGLLSLPFAEGRSISIPEFIRQAVIWLLPYCAVLTYCRRERDFVMIIKAIVIGAGVVAAIAIAEIASGVLVANILAPFIGGDAEWLRNVQEQKIRDGVFRAQASHTHPLSLGEHMALAAPFALALFARARKARPRAFWLALLALILLGALATNSRGAVLGIAVSIGAMAVMLGARILRNPAAARLRPLAGLAAAAVLIASPAALTAGFAVASGVTGVSAANSTQSRLDQIEQALPKIKERPVGGYGTGRAARVLGYWGQALTIDNYYLTLALDLGFPGPAVFFAMLVAFGFSGLARAQAGGRAMRLLYIACFAAAASIAICRSISSLTGNLAMIFMLLAAFAGAGATFRPRRRRRALED